MRNPFRRRRQEEAEMDMTPMIDVTFLLLIFFLCLEFKSLEAKLATNLPKELGPTTAPAEPVEKLDVRIELVRFGRARPAPGGQRDELLGHEVRYYVGATGLRTPEQVLRLLRREAQVRVAVPGAPGATRIRPLVVKSGPGVLYGDVTRVIDLAKEAGFAQIRFGGSEGRYPGGR